jgi:hypothetical protein
MVIYIAKIINLFKIPYKICMMFKDWLYILDDEYR